MGLSLSNIFWLGTKELRSFFGDFVLLGLVVYAFSFAVYVQAHSNAQEVNNASIGVVDQDNSYLSRHIMSAFLPPYFKKPVSISYSDVDHLLDVATYTFIIVIPPHFETDVLAGRNPEIQLNIDATAMVQAGLGSSYIEQILNTEIQKFVDRNEGAYLSRSQNISKTSVALSVRVMYNPNINTAWFASVMAIVNSVTMLAIILAGAAVVREREHGTMDHLLVMPVTPFEIAMSKIWANGLVIAIAVALSLELIVKRVLHIPVVGSVPLFVAGTAIYLFFVTAIGIFLATVARTMPQLGLLYILVAFPMNILSGSNTPLESMPYALRTIMQFSPSTHFVSFAQAILFRGAGFSIVWRDYLYVALTGGLFLFLALLRFRISAAQSS
jgi:ABC-2 type transport system permease protein